MIEFPKYISANGRECPINLGVGVFPFGGHEGIEFSNELVIGVTWMCNETQIKLTFPPEILKIHAYPTPDMKYMVVLLVTKLGPSGQNAIFYDERGIEIFRPQLPLLKSWDEKVLQNSSFEFGNVFWSVRKDFIEFWIERKNDDFFEWRYFNYKSFQWDEENWMRQRY